MSDYFSQFPENEIWLGNESVDKIYKDGVELYRHPSFIERGVMNFTGSQYANLSEPVVLDGNFEIEIEYSKDSTNMSTFFGGASNSTDSVVVDFNNNVIRAFAYDQAGELTPILTTSSSRAEQSADGRTHTASLRYIDSVAYLVIDNDDVDNVNWDLATPVSIAQVAARDSSGFRSFLGYIFGIKVWKNGDRNTGELVLNISFDDPTSDYQRDDAKSNNPTVTDLSHTLVSGSGWKNNGLIDFNNALIFLNENNFAADAYSFPFKYKQGYEVGFEVFDFVSGSVEAVINTSATPNVSANGFYRFKLLTEDSGIQRLIFRARNGEGQGTFKVRGIYFSEYPVGAVMQNTLPGDWSLYERRDGWAFLRNINDPSIKLEDAV